MVSCATAVLLHWLVQGININYVMNVYDGRACTLMRIMLPQYDGRACALMRIMLPYYDGRACALMRIMLPYYDGRACQHAANSE